MTRDEAIRIWKSVGLINIADRLKETLKQEIVDAEVQFVAENDIDGFAALGILKLDEPVSKIAAIDSIIRRHAESRVADCIMGAIRNSKLIEK